MTLIVNIIMTDPPKGGLKRPTKKPANQTPNSVYTTDTTSVEIGKKVEKPKKENKTEKGNKAEKTSNKKVDFDIYQLREDLYGNLDYEAVNSTLRKVNKKNIVDFLTQYYDISGYKGEGFWGLLESIDCKDGITMDSKKNIVKSLLDVADALDLSSCDEYREILKIYKMYDTGRYKLSTNMVGNSDYGPSNSSSTPKGWWKTVGASVAAGAATGSAIGVWFYGAGAIPGAIIGGLVGLVGGSFAEDVMYTTESGHYSTPRDSAKLDRAMYKLHKKIQQKQNQQCYIPKQFNNKMETYEA